MLALLAEPDLELLPHMAGYRVDGEVGRFRFRTFDLKKPNGRIIFSGTSLLPPLKGREWYETSGFKRVALVMGAVERSYRKTKDALNYSRRQPQGGTPLNTLRDTAESEGTAMLEFMETESARVLKEHCFAEDGTPLPEASVYQEMASPPPVLDGQRLQEARLEMQQEMRKRGMPESQVQAAGREDEAATSQKKTVYEDPGATVNISVDDVGVKEQKEQRDRPTKSQAPTCGATSCEREPASQEAARKRPMAYTTVARIEHAGHAFTFVGAGILGVLRFVLAFLLNNGLAGRRWLFFTDGQRNLQNSIVTFFSWYRWTSIILDWFHLIKKCKEELSLGLKGRKLRNQHLKEIARLLWYGLASEAIDYVRAIPEEEIKDKDPVQRLIGYFQRNRAWIPCYALRRRLGLRNSSNPVERTCNLVTSSRQKHNGMSWSHAGSLALASITAVVLNDCTQKWLKQKTIPFVFAQTT